MKPSSKLEQSEAKSAPPAPPERLLLALDEIEGGDLDIVGGKAYRLAQLRRHKVDVLPGLILTTHFFERQIRAARLTPLWTGSPDVAVTAESLSWLADALKAKPLDKVLANALNKQLAETFGPGIDHYAVRSSVIDEDQRDHTFAGIHRTELGVPHTMLPIAITRCWASAMSGPAIKYRQVHGMSIHAIRVALLIQPMIMPQVSGVAFTANPLTGARDELIVEAVWGLGDPLVSGEVQPDFYKLTTGTTGYAILEHQPGRPLPQASPADPLTAEQLATLGRCLEQIQALMGDPQDVEWALQEDRFNILQTRPILIRSGPQPHLNQVWSRANYPQTLPERPSPLLASLKEYGQPHLRRYLNGLGFNLAQSGPYEKFILGRPYLNLTMLKQMLAQLGLNAGPMLSQLGDRATGEQHFTIDWHTVWQGRAIYRAVWRELRSLPAQLDVLARRTATLIKAMDNLAQAAPAAVRLEQFRHQTELYGDLGVLGLGLLLGRGALTGLGSRLLAPASPTPVSLMAGLVAANIPLAHEQFRQALVELGQLLPDSPPAQADRIAPGPGLTDSPQNEPLPVDFANRFKQVLTRYGMRATYEGDPGWPRYYEQPGELLALVRQYAAQPAIEPIDAVQTPAQLSAWRAQALRPLIRRARRLLQTHERWQMLEVEFIAAIRRWCLGLGQTWSQHGWLNSETDIFWLTMEEIERALIAESELAHTLSAIISARQETYQTYQATEVPFLIKESDIAALRPRSQTGSQGDGTPDVTVGQPISPGQARGTVQVVRHPADFEPTDESIILVMASTAPAWLALLHTAAGLIVETGGLLSHGSVIAREYGLPAVANIPQATQRFRTGDKVLVDGSTGVVQLLETASPAFPTSEAGQK